MDGPIEPDPVETATRTTHWGARAADTSSRQQESGLLQVQLHISVHGGHGRDGR